MLPVVGGRAQSAESVVAEVRNAYRAYTDLGCDVIAHGRQPGRPAEDRGGSPSGCARTLPTCPCYVLPDEPALAAPTVAQIAETLGAEVLLGDDAGLARDALDFVFGGAMLPNFLPRADPGLRGGHPGRPGRPDHRLAGRALGGLAADRRGAADAGRDAGPRRSWRWPTGSPPAPRCSRSPTGSFPTAAGLFTLEGKLERGAPRARRRPRSGLFERMSTPPS